MELAQLISPGKKISRLGSNGESRALYLALRRRLPKQLAHNHRTKGPPMSTVPSNQRNWNRSIIVTAAFFMAHAQVRADYPTLIQSDHPKAYYRLNDPNARTLINKNSGTLGAAGNATNDLMYFKGGQLPTGVVHPFPGAIVGDSDRSEFFDSSTRTEIPFNSAFNTPNTQPFTVEAWFYPATDQTGTGQAPINNRYTSGSNRQGWTFFQRRPDSTYFPGDS